MVIFTMTEENTLCNPYNIIQGTVVPCDTLSINVSNFTIFFDMVHHIFMNYVLYGLSCLEYGTIYKHLLLNSVVFKVISVVAIVGSIAILLSKPHKTALQIVGTKQRV